MRRFYLNNGWHAADVMVDCSYTANLSSPIMTLTFQQADTALRSSLVSEPYVVLDERGSLYRGRVVWIDTGVGTQTQIAHGVNGTHVRFHPLNTTVRMELVEV